MPVPIGPAIPRRDREDVKERYCKLMLLLFKPWQCVDDLKDGSRTWAEEFDIFKETAPSSALTVMNNMQILHECKDNRDDHYKNKGGRIRALNRTLSAEYVENSGTDLQHFDGDHEAEVVDHINSMNISKSDKKNKRDEEECEAVNALKYGGIIVNGDDVLQPINTDRDCPNSFQFIAQEKEWRKCYESRRSKWKEGERMNCSAPPISTEGPAESEATLNSLPNAESTPAQTRIQFAFDREAVDVRDASHASQDLLTDIINKFTLNEEQQIAFRIVAERVISKDVHKEPIRMYLGGPGGTGKSRVIDALKDFFSSRDESRRFRLASYTGVAAKNISGMTLHSLLDLSNVNSKKNRTRAIAELVKLWNGVDYLFIDEVSMISCSLLYDINEALMQVKESCSPFGGINMVFAGDFLQLPPVGGRTLYAVSKKDSALTVEKQKNVMGRLLWLGVKQCVLLHRQMRQSGDENSRFRDLLDRLRDGTINGADIRLLNSKVVRSVSNNIKENFDPVDWRTHQLLRAGTT